jgi:hypothetical protein
MAVNLAVDAVAFCWVCGGTVFGGVIVVSATSRKCRCVPGIVWQSGGQGFGNGSTGWVLGVVCGYKLSSLLC